jgi:hypothetical protein
MYFPTTSAILSMENTEVALSCLQAGIDYNILEETKMKIPRRMENRKRKPLEADIARINPGLVQSVLSIIFFHLGSKELPRNQNCVFGSRIIEKFSGMENITLLSLVKKRSHKYFKKFKLIKKKLLEGSPVTLERVWRGSGRKYRYWQMPCFFLKFLKYLNQKAADEKNWQRESKVEDSSEDSGLGLRLGFRRGFRRRWWTLKENGSAAKKKAEGHYDHDRWSAISTRQFAISRLLSVTTGAIKQRRCGYRSLV